MCAEREDSMIMRCSGAKLGRTVINMLRFHASYLLKEPWVASNEGDTSYKQNCSGHIESISINEYINR